MLTPGTRVTCRYRQEFRPVQPHLMFAHVGTVQAATLDAASWNGCNTEADYCATGHLTPVKWDFGRTWHDADDTLYPVCDMPPKDR